MKPRFNHVLSRAVVLCFSSLAIQSYAADAVFSSAVLGAGNFDNSVGLSSSKTYLNAVNLQGGALTINGVNFEASGGGNPSGTNYSISGVGNAHAGGTNNVGGQLGSLLDGFIYNGNPGGLTLSNLTAGQTYSLAFYNRSWSGPGGRTQTLTSSSGATTSYEQDPNNPGDGSLLRYTFTASGASETLNFTPQGGQGSLHLYGFSTEQVFNNTRTGGTDWTTASWSVGAPNAAGANADFTAQGSPTTFNLDAARTVGHVRFDGANAWTLSGANTLTLQADIGGVSVLSTPSGSHTISTSVALNSDMLKSGAGTLTLGGALSGSQSVTVGGGTLRLGQTNSYSGATTVNAGTTLDVNDTTQTLTALNGAGTVLNNGSTAQILTVNSGSFSGNITDHTSGTGTLGLTKSSSGTLTLSGNSTYTGATNINDGTLILSGTLGSGAVTVNGPGSLIANSERSVDRAITLNGGSLGFSYNHVAVGPLTMNGGTMTTTNGAGAGGFESVFLMGNVTVGGSSASVIQPGGSSANRIHMAEAGSGGSAIRTFNVANATGDSAADLIVSAALINGRADGAAVGLNKTGSGTMTLTGTNIYTGTTSVTEGTLSVSGGGIKNSTALNVSAGARIDSDDLNLLPTSGWTIAGTINKTTASGQDIAGAVTLNGGTLSSSATGGIENDWGQYLLAGATFTTTGTSTISASHLGFAGATFSPTGLSDTLTISSIIGTNSAKGGALVKTGSGTVILSAANAYTGATTVSQGKLVVNGNISTSALTTVDLGATLGGSGTVGKTIVNGTLAVGNSPGQMNFTDTLNLAGITIMEIDGTSGAGVTGGHDFVNLTGAGAAGEITYGGTMTLDMGVVFAVGTYSWNLFDMASETGSFTGITLADQYSGNLLDGDSNGVWDLTSGNNTWQFTESTGVLGLTVVPEPSAALLGGLGLLALLRRRR